MKTLSLAVISAITLLLGCTADLAQSTNSLPDADTAWQQLQQAAAAWRPKSETNEIIHEEQLCKQKADAATSIATQAKNFYTQFPGSTNAAAAKALEVQMSRRARILYRIYGGLHAPGNPLDIKFTALDGREVDLSQMKGKVVLVDFWATWCPSCVAEIPSIKEAYDKFHAQGFEVVGISFDSDKKALTDFVQKRDLPWPQFFEGKADSSNKFSSQFNINQIPIMWLADKKGILRETNARDDLQTKIEKLLAE